MVTFLLFLLFFFLHLKKNSCYPELATYLTWTYSFTLKIFTMDAAFFYSAQATDKDWVQLQGKFLLNGSSSKVVIYVEGPPSGTDILLNSLIVKHAEKTPPSPPPVIEVG